MKKTIVIVGGGISGLTLLHYLNEKYQLEEGVDIVLLEKNERLGGTIRTLKQDGVLFETGPNGFLNNRPQTLKLLEELGLKDRMIESSAEAKKRYICRDHKLYAVPSGPKDLVTFPLLKKRDKIAILGEYFKKGAPDPAESIYAFAKRRFSSNIADMMFDSFVNGIFAGDIRQLNLKEAMPRLYKLEEEHGSILKALSQSKSAKPKLCSLEGGMGMLTDQIYKKYSSQIILGETVESMEYKQRDLFITTNKRELRVDHLFVATPSYVAGQMVARIDELFSDCLKKVQYAPIVVVGAVFNVDEWPKKIEGYGYLNPSLNHNQILGVLFENQIFPNRASSDKVMFRVMLGGMHYPDILQKSQQELTALALNEIRATLNLSTEPMHVFYQAWPHAIPQYDQSYVQNLEKLQERAKQHPAVHLLANYLGGIAMNDCIENAHKLATEITL